MSSLNALTIKKQFERTDPRVAGAFAGVPTGVICDAQKRSGAMDYRIKPVTTKQQFHGQAVVVDAGQRDNLAAWAALDVVVKGDVLVIATGGFERASVIGDNYVGMASNAGVVAVVTDGMVRDTVGIEAVGIPVFAAGVSPNSPWKNGPGTVGLSAPVGGVCVASGDIVVGDGDGVVVVPRARAEEVADQLKDVLAKEHKMDSDVKSGAIRPDWLDEAYDNLGAIWLEE